MVFFLTRFEAHWCFFYKTHVQDQGTHQYEFKKEAAKAGIFLDNRCLMIDGIEVYLPLPEGRLGIRAFGFLVLPYLGMAGFLLERKMSFKPKS